MCWKMFICNLTFLLSVRTGLVPGRCSSPFDDEARCHAPAPSGQTGSSRSRLSLPTTGDRCPDLVQTGRSTPGQDCRLRSATRSGTAGTPLQLDGSFSLQQTACSFATPCYFNTAMCRSMPFHEGGFVQLTWCRVAVDEAIQLQIPGDVTHAGNQGNEEQQNGGEYEIAEHEAHSSGAPPVG